MTGLSSLEPKEKALIENGCASVHWNFTVCPTIDPDPTMITPFSHEIHIQELVQDKMFGVSNSWFCSSGGSLCMEDFVLLDVPIETL